MTQTSTLDSSGSSLVALLRSRGERYPDRHAFTFLADGETEADRITYGELDHRAKVIAARLQAISAKNERVLLLFPPSLEYIAAFFGCLYAGAVAVPAYPPDPARLTRTLPRLLAIVKDCRPRIALTLAPLLGMVEAMFASTPVGSDIRCLATDLPLDVSGDGWQDPGCSLDSLAFLQYTSGSTSVPKGVILNHGNLLHNLAKIQQSFELDADSRGVFWLPPYHDMGLIGGILGPIHSGFPAWLMSPIDFLKRPLRWLQAISQYQATHSGGPNFAYDLCCRKISPEQIARLDLSRWKLAFNGAEPIHATTLDQFVSTFANCGFRRESFFPCYGLAEATLLVSGGRQAAPPVIGNFGANPAQRDTAHTLVSCGRQLPEHQIAIVDPVAWVERPQGEEGEIWVAGPSIAQGYFGLTEETAATFHARFRDSQAGPFLRTGDLGFLRDGELFVTGRIKDLIIIRGVNHYPQDIERTVEQCHPALRVGCSVAFSLSERDHEQLVIVAELKSRCDPDQAALIVAQVRQAITEEHQLHLHAMFLVEQGTVLKTSSGKIQRRATKAALQAGELPIFWKSSETDPASDHVAADVLPAKPTPATEPATPASNTPFASPPPVRMHIVPPNVTAIPKDVREAPQAAEIQHWLSTRIAAYLGVPEAQVDQQAPFSTYGLDSAGVIEVTGEFEQWLGRTLSPTLLYEYPTIEALANYLVARSVAKAPLSPQAETVTYHEPIAIIGIGCRFPGADTPEAFWQLLRDGKDAISEIPSDRWSASALYDKNPDIPGKMNTRWGGFLCDIDRFDAAFFSVSPREASAMDPQQRILLEVAWEAMENAGQAPKALRGTRTGVFIGISTSDYSLLELEDPTKLDAYGETGNAHSIAANRLSYLLDLHGPSMAVDTACSSSLVATHLACQSLLNAESDLALVGGVNVMLLPQLTIGLSKAHMMAPDGRCKTFDASADGYVRGEGCGVLLLKRLSRAVADGNPIVAVIRGSAVDQDGFSNGLTAPNGLAQQEVIRQALDHAGVVPSQISLIEAHGTGTSLGDPIEIDALKSVLATDPSGARPCAIGSVKTNIGHLEAAAGIAGLIKVALALQQKAIPPHLHLRQLNPRISIEGTRFFIPTTLQPWPSDSEGRFAGISSFGFGGTNAHVILEEAPRRSARASSVERPLHVITLSAKSEQALRTLAGRYHDLLSAGPEASLADIGYSANTGRAHLPYRLAAVSGSVDQLTSQISSYLSGSQPAGLYSGQVPSRGRIRIGFLFTGQGSQYAHMGLQLFETQPAYRKALERCDALLRHRLDRPLLSVIFPSSPEDASIHSTAYTQPALFALEYALAELWRSFGIVPDAVMGHSVGEYVAACVAGIFSLEDALALIAERGRLMQSLSQRGAMAAVLAGEEQVLAAIAPHRGDVSIASVNGPQSIVISGAEPKVNAVLSNLIENGVQSRVLNVSHAFHSSLIDPILDEFERAVGKFLARPPCMTLISNLTGKAFAPGEIPDAAYWRRHAREPVRFNDGVQALVQAGIDHFVEIGPHPTLLGLGRNCLPAATGTWLASLRQGEQDWAVLLNSLASLYIHGAPVDWAAFDTDYSRQVVKLPNYPFERKPYWVAKHNPAQSVRIETRDGDISDRKDLEKENSMGTPNLPDRPMIDQMLSLLHKQADTMLSQTDLLRRQMDSLMGNGFLRLPLQTPTIAQPTVAPNAGMKLTKEQVKDSVVKLISEVSAYPANELRLDRRLIEDLGFDSLMLAKLLGQARSRFPGSVLSLKDIYQKQVTLGDIIQSIWLQVSGQRAEDEASQWKVAGSSQPLASESAPTATTNSREVVSPSASPDTRRSALQVKIEDFPEYQRLQQRIRSVPAGQNPYFKIHQGVNKNSVIINGKEAINYSSYNYVGLSGHPLVTQAAQDAVAMYGTSVSASRLLSGEIPLHQEFEQELARFIGTEAAVVLVSGHATNVTTIGHLVGPEDLLLHDELCHNSIVQGCLMSGAKRQAFPHQNWDAVDRTLTQLRPHYRRAMILLEGVYSMDGDIPDLPRAVELKKRHGALLYVDEAHSIGVLGRNGRGICEHFGVNPSDVDILMGTLSKSLASCGGYIAGRTALVDYLRWTAPGFIFSAGITPANTAAALSALRVLQAEPQRLIALRERSQLFLALARDARLNTGASNDTPVIPVVLGNSELSLKLAQALSERGINVQPILYPAVSEDASCLRFFVTSSHTEQQIRQTVEAMTMELARLTPSGPQCATKNENGASRPPS